MDEVNSLPTYFEGNKYGRSCDWANTLLKVLDGQPVGLDGKYQHLFEKKRNVR
jgi:hypothetical protein